MNSEREIVKKLFESKDYDTEVSNQEELEEASFEANGKTYSCAFGHYSCDGEPISREDYFAAKDGKRGGSSNRSNEPAKKGNKKSESSGWGDWKSIPGDAYLSKDIEVGNLVGTIYDARSDGDGFAIDFYDNDKMDQHWIDGVSGESFRTEKQAMKAIEQALGLRKKDDTKTTKTKNLEKDSKNRDKVSKVYDKVGITNEGEATEYLKKTFTADNTKPLTYGNTTVTSFYHEGPMSDEEISNVSSSLKDTLSKDWDYTTDDDHPTFLNKSTGDKIVINQNKGNPRSFISVYKKG